LQNSLLGLKRNDLPQWRTGSLYVLAYPSIQDFRMPFNALTQPETSTAQPKKISRSSTFRALRHRNYKLWFAGQGISLIGTWMQSMAQQVLVYNLTGSAASLGIISLIGLIPLIPLSLWSGSLSDRMSKRTIIIICQSAMLVQALILAILCWNGRVQLWHVYLLAFFLGVANAMDLPARQAFTVEMVEGKEDLTNAIALNSAMFNGARAIGPAMAGLMVAATGVGTAFFINALSFIAVIASLLAMRNLPKVDHPVIRTSTMEHMAEGIRFLTKQQTLMVLFGLIAVSAYLSMPYSTLMPVFADVVLKDSAAPLVNAVCGGAIPLTCQSPEALPLGILLTVIGIGAMIGALLVASLPDHSRRGYMLTAGNLLFPFFLILFSLSHSFILSAVLMLFVGFSFVVQNSLANTLLQLTTPDEMRGRVMSVYTMIFQTMMRLGGLQAGFLSDWLTAPVSVGIGAVVSLFYGLYVAIRYPKVRQMH
jgi:MFS family permease